MESIRHQSRMFTKSGQIIPLKCLTAEGGWVLCGLHTNIQCASHEHCPSWDLASNTIQTGTKSPNCTRPASLLPQTSGGNDVTVRQEYRILRDSWYYWVSQWVIEEKFCACLWGIMTDGWGWQCPGGDAEILSGRSILIVCTLSPETTVPLHCPCDWVTHTGNNTTTLALFHWR